MLVGVMKMYLFFILFQLTKVFTWVFAFSEIILETAFEHPQEVTHFPCAPSSDHRCKSYLTAPFRDTLLS